MQGKPEVADGHFLVLRELSICYIMRILLLKKQLTLHFLYNEKKKGIQRLSQPEIILVGINNREIKKGKSNIGEVHSFQLLLDKLTTFLSLTSILKQCYFPGILTTFQDHVSFLTDFTHILRKHTEESKIAFSCKLNISNYLVPILNCVLFSFPRGLDRY